MNLPKTTIYTPDSALARPMKMLRDSFSDLVDSRELAWRLAVRDISAQYRQAFLGLLWAFLLPLSSTVAWIFLTASGMIQVSATDLPYPVYVFTGTMLWSILMDAVNAPLAQVNAAKGMLAKLNFPREALIISGIYQILFNTAIKIVLLLAALLVVGINPGWNLLFFPLGIMSLILVGTAIGLLLTPIGTLYSDVGRAIGMLMQYLMFVTPVIFPMPKTGLAALLFNLNPFTPLILTCRDWLTGFTPQYLGAFLLVNLAALIVLLIAWSIYRLAMPIIIERMSS